MVRHGNEQGPHQENNTLWRIEHTVLRDPRRTDHEDESGDAPVPKMSAGLLLYRESVAGDVEVLLVHPGGPFWARKDAGAWSIPKGEYGEGDDPGERAEQEFAEELGRPAPPGPRLDLGEVRQAGGKRVRAWAVRGDIDVAASSSNNFDMEWPPRSGEHRSFPEVDKAAWFSLEDARTKVLAGQIPLVERLEEGIRGAEPG